MKSKSAIQIRKTFVIWAFGLIFSACNHGGGGSASSTSVQVTAEQLFAGPHYMVGLAYTPQGDLLFTELATGDIRWIPAGQNQPLPQPFARLPVPREGVEGLLGIAVDPEFDKNRFVYVYQTAPNPRRNRVVRFRAQGPAGVEALVIIDNIPVGLHNGGKFGFDDSHRLYVSTGDAGDPALAQDPASLAGKILRLNRDGSVPADNPFPGSPVFALGFRNVFGIAKSPEADALYVSENGPDCDDEIDRLQAGANYGWRPGQPCGDTDPQFLQPVHRINPSAGATGALFYDGEMFPELRGQLLVAGYNAGEIRRLTVDESAGGTITGEAILFPGGVGAVIDLAQSPGGEIVFSTANTLFRLIRTPPPAPERRNK